MNISLKSFIFFFQLLLIVFSASAQNYTAGNGLVFTINKNQPPSNVHFEEKKTVAGLNAVTFTFKGSSTMPLPSVVSIYWSVPMIGLTGYWTPNSDLPRFIAMRTSFRANLANQAPVFSLFGDNNSNRYTFALSDAFHKTICNLSVKEEEARMNCAFNIELAPHEQKKDYQVTVLIDDRQVPYYNSIENVASWWASMPAYKPAEVPASAELPVYSTWYSYHQNFTEEQLLEECVQAKAIGYEIIIVDDGWQTLDTKRGYAYTGDWEPERIKNMAAFVQRVHDTGMKFMLWYAVPFIGYKSPSFDQFKGKYIYMNDRLSAGVLDPRYPQARKFIVSKYVKHLKDWNLDGFKLDFIDNFTNSTSAIPAVTAEADFTSLYEGVDQLMVDIKNALTAAKPDILIEFRQSYIGPAMRKYGNMFRAADCPNSALANRIRTTDLRLTAGNTAVHADMIMWNYAEPVQLAAQQFSNILFSVPQLSVRLKDIPASHLNMVKFYTRFWLDNKDVLLDGRFEANHPELNYPLLQSTLNKKKIAGLYSDIPVTLDLDMDKTTVVNAKNNKDVAVRVLASGKYLIEVMDCEGRVQTKFRKKLNKGMHLFQVPVSGVISFNKW